MKIAIVTDAWEPQVNGVVRTLKMTAHALGLLGHQVEFVSPQGFFSVPCPTYPDIRLAAVTPGRIARVLDALAPDCLHIATEGPLGWAARSVALSRGWPFTTAYHSRFPEYVQLRTRIPVSWSHALLRRFHNAAAASTCSSSPRRARRCRAPRAAGRCFSTSAGWRWRRTSTPS
ncbi:MAG: hypothetical protein RJB37_2414 [Pseudomonadota bacterium]